MRENFLVAEYTACICYFSHLSFDDSIVGMNTAVQKLSCFVFRNHSVQILSVSAGLSAYFGLRNHL
jgi:hypothetical protein